MATKPTKKLSRTDYTIGWICALSIELAASSGMLDEVHENLDLVPGDKNMYTLGEIRGHNIVMACLPAGNMGITPASNVATNMMRSFPKIRFGLMVGIGGGAPARRARPNEDIRLGDVVVSIPQGELGGVVKYDHGKVVADGEFKHTGLLNMPPTPLINAVSKLKAKHEFQRNAIQHNVTAMINRVMESEDANPDFADLYERPNLKYDRLFAADYDHNESQSDSEASDYSDDSDEIPLPCRRCDSALLVTRKPRKSPDTVIHYGTIASADKVMRHGVTRDKIRKKYGVLCFEMEAAGLMNDFPCLVVRGICDYSDSHKHKIWQRYAAAVAAAYTKELLELVLKEDIETTKEAVKVLEEVKQGINKIEHKVDVLVQDKQRQDRKKTLNWLDSDIHTKRFIDSHARWQPRTGSLLLDAEQYSNWVNNDTQTLWCHGIAGGGKTVFASVVIDNLKAAQRNKTPETRDGVACLFCEYERQKDQTVRSLTCAILRQLADQCEELPESVTELFDRYQADDAPLPFEEISSTLSDVLGKFPQVFLVVDALDECSDNTRKELLSHLLEQQRNSNMKLLATSRPTIKFLKEFGPCEELEIRADPEDVKDVLDILIDKSDTIVKADPALRRRVKDSISQAVDGMFLLVQPFLDSIIGQRSRGYVEDALRALVDSPDKISTVYDGALGRIGSQKSEDRKLAQRILSWIVDSKRPLSRQEFLQALAVKPGDLTFQKDYIIDDLDGAVALCAGLVVINRGSNTVQLMHHTTRKYFEDFKHRPDWMTGAHGMIASACITCVSYSVFDEGPCDDDEALESRLLEYPFLEYAAQHWGTHAQEDQVQIAEVEDLALEFLQHDAKVASSTQVMHPSSYRQPGYSQDFVRGVTGLQIASAFGLANIVLRLVRHGVDTTDMDDDERTALHRAAENGHDEVVLILLEHGAEVNAQEAKYDQTPLHLAALNGHKAVVQTLLESDADAKMKDSDGWMPIHVAAWTGNEEVARVLLGKIDVDETGRDNLTALHCAAAQGHQKVARLLIQRGADVDAIDVDGWTPLHWASKKRHDMMKPRVLTLKEETSTLLRQFLAKQEEVKESLNQHVQSFQDKLNHLTEPLAVWQSRLSWLPLGDELNITGHYGDVLATLRLATDMGTMTLPWNSTPQEDEPPAPTRFIFAIQDELTALHCATECRHESVARLLIRNGAEVDKKCRASIRTDFALELKATPTPLHLASFSGHEAIVRLLLKEGVSVHTKSGSQVDEEWTWPHADWAALHWAIVSGNQEVLQLLLDYGADVQESCRIVMKSMRCRLTPLHLAVILGHEEFIRILIANKVDVNAKEVTVLDVDIDLKPVREEGDGKVTLKSRLNPGAMHLAALLGRHKVVEMLLENKADTEMILHISIGLVNLQLTALHMAVMGKHKKATQLLLQSGADVQSKLRLTIDNYMRAEITPLHLAIFVNSINLPKLLIQSGADVDAMCQVHTEALVPPKKQPKPQMDQTPGTTEEDEDDDAILRRLLTRTTKLFATFLGEEIAEEIAEVPVLGKAAQTYNKHRDSVYDVHVELAPLHIATMCMNEKLVQLLIENTVDANAKAVVNVNQASVQFTALHVAMICGHEEVVQRLFDFGVGVHETLRIYVGSWLILDATVLQLAVLSGKQEVVQFLIEKAVDVDAKCVINNKRTSLEFAALHLATILRHDKIIHLLLDSGANIHAKLQVDAGSWLHLETTVLQLAAISGKEEVAQLFLDRGFDASEGCLINNETSNTVNALHLAAIFNHGAVMQLLVNSGGDLSKSFRVRFDPWLDIELTLLHLAAMFGNMDTVEVLVKAGSDAHTNGKIRCYKMHAESTVQHIALIRGHQEVVELLLDENPDVHAKCHFEIAPQFRAELTMLHVAALSGNISILRMLLDAGADPQQRAIIHSDSVSAEPTVLHLAAISRHWNLVEQLFDTEVDIQAPFKLNVGDMRAEFTLLHLAALSRNPGIVQLLFNQGFDINSVFQIEGPDTRIEITALHLAFALASEEVAQAILECGADADARCRIMTDELNVNLTALHLATGLLNENMVRLLFPPELLGRDARQNTQWRSNFFGDPYDCDTDTPLQSNESSQHGFAERSQGHPEEDSSKSQMDDIVGSAQEPLRTQPREHTIDSWLEETAGSPQEPPREHCEEDPIERLMGDPAGNSQESRREHSQESRREHSQESRREHSQESRREHSQESRREHSEKISEDQSVEHVYEHITQADVNARFLLNFGNTRIEFSAVHWAALARSPKIASVLLKNNANANATVEVNSGDNHVEFNASHLAVAWGYQPLLQSLLAGGADTESRLRVSIGGVYAELPVLHLAAMMWSTKVTGSLLDNHADTQAKCPVGIRKRVKAELTVLHLVALSKHDDIAGLLSKGVDIHGKCLADAEFWLQSEFTVRDMISVFNHPAMTDLFDNVEQRVEPDGQTDGSGGIRVRLMALLAAAATGGNTIAELVLSSVDDIDGECCVKLKVKIDTAFKIPMQADIDATFEIDMEAKLSTLHLAAVLGDVDTVRLLLGKGASLEGKCQIDVGDFLQARLSPLQLAAMWKQDGVVQLLLKKGANANAMGQLDMDRTVQADLIAPHLATLFGHEGVLRLLKKGADIDAKIQAHLAALHFAALMDDDVVTRTLLEHGAEVDASCLVNVEAKIKDNVEANVEARLTALHVAAWAGHERVARLLLKTGADVNSVVQVGGTATLIQGARINRKLQAGGTAMHLAAGLGREEVLRILIDSGANVKAKSQDGRTPLQWAKDHGHDGAAKLIIGIQLNSSGTAERGRFRQRWHDVFSKGDVSASPSMEEGNSLARRNESPRPEPEEGKYRKEGVGNFLMRFAMQKAEKLRRARETESTPKE